MWQAGQSILRHLCRSAADRQALLLLRVGPEGFEGVIVRPSKAPHRGLGESPAGLISRWSGFIMEDAGFNTAVVKGEKDSFIKASVQYLYCPITVTVTRTACGTTL